jgi:hypothetical protein
MTMRFELSDRFHDDGRVCIADRHSKMAIGLFALSLSWMADRGWDPSPGSDRFFPEPIGWMLVCGTRDRPVSRRAFNALERAGLWLPITNRKGKQEGGWHFAGAGELWRLRPLRESISRTVRTAVLARDGRTCQLCGLQIPDGETLHLDHKIPVSRFGRSTVENLQVTHPFCNLSKGARVLGGVA